jgi:hypothetical protein
MLMFVAAFLTFMAIGGFPSFVEDMKVSIVSFHYYDLNLIVMICFCNPILH